MKGEPHLREMRQALFYCPELYDKVCAPRARHYHRIDDHWTLMIVQDSRRYFTLHATVEKDEDMAALFEKIVGTPVKYEMLHCAKWVQRLLLAEHYQQGRAFIAGATPPISSFRRARPAKETIKIHVWLALGDGAFTR